MLHEHARDHRGDEATWYRDRLCFTDLMLSYHLRDLATRYTIDAFDRRGKSIGYRRTIAAMSGGRTCTTGLVVDGYTIVRIRVYRNARVMPPLFVHLAPDRSGRPAIIGLRRE